MRYMPLFVDLCHREILIIGGGRVALRRARQYADAGGRLTVIAPDILPEFAELANASVIQRGAELTDVSNRFLLVVIASSNHELNAAIAGECRKSNILFNRCDSFNDGNFINGSIVTNGEIICSTVSGGVPAVSKYLQKKIEHLVTPELVKLANLLAELRPAIKDSKVLAGSHQEFIASWVNDETLARLHDESIDILRKEILACL